MSFRSIALFSLCICFAVSLFGENTNSIPLSWPELTHQAKTSYTPVVLLVYKGESKAFKKLHQKTWKDENLKKWLSGKFLSWTIDADAPRQGEDKILDKVKTDGQTSIIILHPTGYMMGKVDGFVKADVLKNILGKHLNRTFIFPARPILTLAHAPEPKFTIGQELSFNLGTTRGEEASWSLNESVEGFEPYALDKNLLIKGGSESFGLLLYHDISSKSLKRKIKKVNKFWKGNVWVFQLAKDGANEGNFMAIGPFDSRDQAEVYAKGLHNFQNIPSSLFSFSQFFTD